MSLQLNTRQVGDVTVLDASGKVTLGEGSAQFREKIKDLLNAGNKKILVNMADITYIDSSGLGELVSAFTSVANAGGAMKLLNLGKRVEDLLQITKLYTVFETFTEEPAAVRSFA
ncbi:MAG: STAS domain-containing protein [Acidobacteria bacterium]|nr:STAS domain-containing protein [Acidobacteriota bacterium]